MMPLCSRRSRQALPDGSYSQIWRERERERERLSQEMSQQKLEPKSKLTNLIHFKEAEIPTRCEVKEETDPLVLL